MHIIYMFVYSCTRVCVCVCVCSCVPFVSCYMCVHCNFWGGRGGGSCMCLCEYFLCRVSHASSFWAAFNIPWSIVLMPASQGPRGHIPLQEYRLVIGPNVLLLLFLFILSKKYTIVIGVCFVWLCLQVKILSTQKTPGNFLCLYYFHSSVILFLIFLPTPSFSSPSGWMPYV